MSFYDLTMGDGNQEARGRLLRQFGDRTDTGEQPVERPLEANRQA